MKRSSYNERDYTFGQTMLTLRTHIGLTQAGLGKHLGVSRRAVAQWEGGLSYPAFEHLKQFIELGIQLEVFQAGHEAEEIRALWRAAHQKVQLNEAWLLALLTQPAPPPVSLPIEEADGVATVKVPTASVQLSTQAQTPVAHPGEEPAVFQRVDWVGALDVSHFTGREVEVAELSQWIVQEHCRVVTLLGMGGIGKSMLASYLGQHLAPHFEAVLWRSVRDAPSCEGLIADCITFFSETPSATFPISLELQINQLLTCLQAHRCLLVLDNLEALLESGDHTGGYLPGYEGYGRFIERLAEAAHQSCVLLTSREKPKEIGPLEGVRSPVRSLRLAGLDERAAQELLIDKGLSGTPVTWQRLVTNYAGNPLALKIVAQVVLDLFRGDLDRFLHEGELIFNGIRSLLHQQMGRLTPLEHLLLTWLAVLREWTKLDTLIQVLHPRVRRSQVLEALEALSRRSLLEVGQQASFSLQSVVMEYLTYELGKSLNKEIVLGDPQQLRRVALEQAQAKDYVRQTQVRLLVRSLIVRLQSELGADALVEAHLLRLLEQFRAEDVVTQGYGPANVISLLKSLRGHLRDLDLSRLSIRGAYLQDVEMHDANLSGAQFAEVVWTSAFDMIIAVATSSDGRYIAAGSNGGQVHIWDQESLLTHLTFRGHAERVGAVAFSPDGTMLVTTGWDGTVRAWDAASGAIIWTARDDGIAATSLAISPAGKLISGSHDGAIRLWDLRTGTLQARLQAHGEWIAGLAFSPDDRLFASGGANGIIQLWDAEQRTRLWELSGHDGWVGALAFAPGAGVSLLASGSLDRTVKLWDMQTKTCLRTLEGHTNLVLGLAWSPDGRTLASASFDTTLRLWDPKTGQCRHILQGHHDAVTSMAFLPTGERLLSGSYDRTVRTWDVYSGQNLHTVAGYAPGEYTLAWSPDGRFLVSGSSVATLTLWNVAARMPVQHLHGHRQRMNTVAWSRASNRIASGSEDRTVRLWDPQTGICTRILQGHTAGVYSVGWSADGSLLASGGIDGRVYIWDVQEGASRLSIEGGGHIVAMAWSPDNTLLASSTEEGLVQIFRATDGHLLRHFELAGTVSSLCWSPGGEYLVNGSERGVLSIWDMQQGRFVHTLEGHSSFVNDVDWSFAHDILVSAGADGTIRWWDPLQGVHLATLQAHDGWARAARISPDGQTVASCGEDGVIQIWEMQSHKHLSTLRADRPYERLNISHTNGLTEAQRATLHALGALGSENDTPPLA